jgi:hypothetical protein
MIVQKKSNRLILYLEGSYVIPELRAQPEETQDKSS